MELVREEFEKEKLGMIQDFQKVKDENETLKSQQSIDKQKLHSYETIEKEIEEKKKEKWLLEGEKEKLNTLLGVVKEEKQLLLLKVEQLQMKSEEMHQSLCSKESNIKTINEELQLKSKKYSNIGLLTQSLLKSIDTK